MMIAAFCFYGSLVFYNSYLPEIAAEKDRDRISARIYIRLYWKCDYADYRVFSGTFLG